MLSDAWAVFQKREIVILRKILSDEISPDHLCNKLIISRLLM